ncbi:hypothetical protein LRAMOSA00287 [Lichtheimia ramosa]|uniref:F-box domain-containing protein n=1 Tax=Lichtheimia ramosa TaxID=688394 RepID=A0A077W7V8_9FUNG|nr:hypothetical protein LRAMOSA00287 [Lichtheimia ramosa]
MDLLPPEIIIHTLKYLSLADLVRAERTCKSMQAFCHWEIEHRITTGPLKNDWGVLVHLDQANATATHFDTKTRQVTYKIEMEKPIQIKTMFDHRRQIQCSLLRRNQFREDFVFTVEKGISEGATIPVAASGADLCQVNGALTRVSPINLSSNDDGAYDKKRLLAPSPLVYSLQLTQMRIPLSTIAAQ